MKKLDIIVLIIILGLSLSNPKENNASSMINKTGLTSDRLRSVCYCGACSIKESVMEIWKNIPRYEGFYQASTYDRIKSVERFVKHNRGGMQVVKERILKLSIKDNGYYCVGLHKKGKQETFYIHFLILLTFEGKSNLQCNHLNCDKSNNRLENLEYCTAKENNQHAWKNNRMKNVGFNKKKVSQFTKEGRIINSFDSLTEASKKTGVAISSISSCLYGRHKSAGGHDWMFSL